MRVMVVVKANKESEAGQLPSERLLTEMGNYNEELVKAGMVLAGEGLHPSSKGVRVRFGKGKPTVLDGPFTETKELIAGYWMWKVKSMADAIEWAKRIPNPDGAESEVEIRPVYEMDDFGAEFTPELREQETRQREEMDKRAKEVGGGAATNAAAGSTANSKQIFVNLPVKDLRRSTEFFTNLGYKFNAQFTDENAACLIVSESIYVMLLVEKFFKTFTTKPVADAKTTTEALVGLSAESRDAVNRIVETALAAGARRTNDPVDHGFMYQWGFEDPDGHIWEYFWMDPAHIQ